MSPVGGRRLDPTTIGAGAVTPAAPSRNYPLPFLIGGLFMLVGAIAVRPIRGVRWSRVAPAHPVPVDAPGVARRDRSTGRASGEGVRGRAARRADREPCLTAAASALTCRSR
jgi:hypothetical protein